MLKVPNVMTATCLPDTTSDMSGWRPWPGGLVGYSPRGQLALTFHLPQITPKKVFLRVSALNWSVLPLKNKTTYNIPVISLWSEFLESKVNTATGCREDLWDQFPSLRHGLTHGTSLLFNALWLPWAWQSGYGWTLALWDFHADLWCSVMGWLQMPNDWCVM